MLSKIGGLLSNDMAIDLGTANTLVHVDGRGLVVEQPSVVALQISPSGARSVLAVGEEAKVMLGRTPQGIETIKPMRDGVIAEFAAAEQMIRTFITKSKEGAGISRPRILISVPASSTSVERRAVYEAAITAGGRKVYMIEEPVAAAIGCDLPVFDPRGSMIVDIGGGTTDIAVLSLGGIISSSSIRSAGNSMDDAIVHYIRRNHEILVANSVAEKIKLDAGSATTPVNGHRVNLKIKGRNLRTGMPGEIVLGSEQITEALKEPLDLISLGIHQVLEELPPEIAADIAESGICLTGGGALLRHIDDELKRRTGVDFYIPDDPQRCVINGSAKVLQNLKQYQSLLVDII